jgi:hypothetical protein
LQQPLKPQPSRSGQRHAQVPFRRYTYLPCSSCRSTSEANASFRAAAWLEDKAEPVDRRDCDACIKNGLELHIRRGFDPRIYAAAMGASLNASKRDYPGWLE